MPELLVVDDEIPVRLALKNLGDWKSCGIDTVHEACNGREALTVLDNNPAIAVLITDIKMPVMGGLELIALAQKFHPKLRILVLSAFNDYDLIREAFKQGARDYILKPRMEPDAVVRQVKECLSGTEQSGSASFHTDTPEYRTREWLQLLTRSAVHSDTEVLTMPDDLAVRIERLSVLHVWVDDFSRVQARYLDHTIPQFISSLSDIVARFLSGYAGSFHISASPQEFIIFLPWKTAAWNIEARQDLHALYHALRHYLDITVSIGISTPVDDAGQLGVAVREAQSLVHLRHLLGHNRIILPQDAYPDLISDQGLPVLDTTLLLNDLAAGEFEKAHESWKTTIGLLATYRLPQMLPYRQTAVRLVFQLFDQLTKANLDVTDILGAVCDPSNEVALIESVPELCAWLVNLGCRCIEGLKQRRRVSTSNHILQAKRILDGNFRDAELSLVTVARKVGLSKTYFSSLFEKETGQNFTEYLNTLRIREAQRLLKTSNQKLYEISERCGFNSVEYFGRTFRKVCGIPPAQYR